MIPFRIEVPDAELADLRDRLRRTRWPDEEPVADWSQGVPLAYLRELCEYWATEYDWRATERRLNRLSQYRTEIDGVGIHFLHVRSPHENALPLIMTHGWPGSVLEFEKSIPLLTEPETRRTRFTWWFRPFRATASAIVLPNRGGACSVLRRRGRN